MLRINKVHQVVILACFIKIKTKNYEDVDIKKKIYKISKKKILA